MRSGGNGRPAIGDLGWMVSAICVLSLFLAGCFGGERGPVADSTMVNVLVDLHLANGRIEVTDRPLPEIKDSILTTHGLDSASFEEALAYYAYHPDQYGEIYGRVVDRLSAERAPVSDFESLTTRDSLQSPSYRVPDRPFR